MIQRHIGTTTYAWLRREKEQKEEDLLFLDISSLGILAPIPSLYQTWAVAYS